jgi:8-oxo-dGTP diphosphatase
MENRPRIACAVLVESGRVLIGRRKAGISNGGLWEFPGGKVEAGESDEACLEREFKEEFGLSISVGGFFMETGCPGTEYVLAAYFARSGGSFAFLLDHDALAFEKPEALSAYAFSPADVPIAESLAERGLGD